MTAGANSTAFRHMREMRNSILRVEIQWDFLFVSHRQWPFGDRRHMSPFLVLNHRFYNETKYLG